MGITRGRGTPRQCPIGGPGLEQCPRTVRAGQLMCGPHWRIVPKDLASEVWRTWRHFDRTGEGWDSYSVARAAAIDAVTEQLRPKESTTDERPERPW